jgi:hypothetical protein
MIAFGQFGGYSVRPVGGIFGAAGIAETAFASERNMLDGIAFFAQVLRVSFFRVLAVDDFLHFFVDDRSYGFLVCTHSRDKCIPIILKYFLDGVRRLHLTFVGVKSHFSHGVILSDLYIKKQHPLAWDAAFAFNAA